MNLLKKVFKTGILASPADAGERKLSVFFLKGSISVMIVYGVSVALGFVLNYLLIRNTGLNNYGVYIYALNLVSMIAGFSIIGTDNLLIKNLPVYKEQQDKSYFKGLQKFSLLTAIVFSLIAGLVSVLALHSLPAFISLNRQDLYLLFLAILPLIAVLTVYQASFQALGKPVLSLFADKILRPGLFLMVIAGLFLAGLNFNISGLIMTATGVLVVAILVVMIIHYKTISVKISSVSSAFQTGLWLRVAFSFFVLDLLYNIRTRADIFLLGILRTDTAELAACNIILKLSELVSFGLFLVNMLLAPLVSNYLAGNEKEKLQNAVTYSARLALLFSLPVFIFILVAGNYILRWFEVATHASYISLMILCFAQLVNVLFGSTGILLSMSGNQKASIVSLSVSLLLNILLDILLIPGQGIIGVAIASGTGILIWNLFMYFYVRKKVNLRTTAFKFI